jgi:transposase
MPYYIGLDASKKATSICVMDSKGGVFRQGKVETTPAAIIGFLRGNRQRYARLGIEASPMANWLVENLTRARLPAICIEARHAHGVLKAQANKTDEADARGLADLMRTGIYKAVHIKSEYSRKVRALLTARRLLIRKAMDIQNGLRAFLLELGVKLPCSRATRFGPEIDLFLKKHSFASSVVAPLLNMRNTLMAQARMFERRLAQIARDDLACQLFVTIPGVGPLTALSYRAAIDDPLRFVRSRSVGPHLGLAPRTFQTGGTMWRGRITKHGDRDARTALCIAARVLLAPRTRQSWLKTWGEQIAKQRGRKCAGVAVARRLAVIMHRMWINQAAFRLEGHPACQGAV